VSDDVTFNDWSRPADINRYAGKVVAIRGGEVIASADSLAALLEQEGVTEDAVISVVREPGLRYTL